MSNPTFTITMENGGVMTGDLYPDKAPNSVNNFISLDQQGLLRRPDLPPCHPRLHDPGRLPRRHRHGGARL